MFAFLLKIDRNVSNQSKREMMAKATNDFDILITELLQKQGLIKKEAEAYLKKEVYQLEQQEIQKIKNYSRHFGISAKEKLIQEILDLRRESLFNRLITQSHSQKVPTNSAI